MPQIVGTDFDDSLNGTDGADTIEAGAGSDNLFGSAGNDVLDAGPSIFDTVRYEFSSADTLSINNNVAQSEQFGTDTLIGVEAVRVTGSSGNDRIEVDGHNAFLFGGLGSDTLIAGSGDDFLSGDPVLEADAEQSADVLMAGAGDDTLNAGPGDTVTGGAGSDLFYISVELGVDNIEDAAVITDFEVGRDDIGNLFILQDLSAFSIAPGTGEYAGDSVITLTESGQFIAIVRGITVESFDGLEIAKDTLTGTNGDDTLAGRAEDDLLSGGDGDDLLLGGGGDRDTLIGGNGDDTLDGGEGDFDTVDYRGAGSGVVFDAANGTAVLESGETDIVSGIERVFGTNFDDRIIGDGSFNLLSGEFGSDYLDGAGGQDILFSGSNGDDTLLGGDGFDQIIVSTSDSAIVDAGSGPDLITVSNGTSTLAGGDGADTFRISSFEGRQDPFSVTITDFDRTEGDFIQIVLAYDHADPNLQGVAFVRPISFEEILLNASDVDGNTLISLPYASITIENIAVDELTRDMFSPSGTGNAALTDGAEGDFDAFLTEGISWEPSETLTYSIDPAFNETMVALIRDAIEQVARVANLNFVEEEGGVLSFELNPNLTSAGEAEVVDRSGTFIQIRSNDEPQLVVFHELGHALGLFHPEESQDYNPDIHRAPFTIMQGVGLPAIAPADQDPALNPEYDPSLVTGFFSLDLEALIELYGESDLTHGDDTYVFDTSVPVFQGLHDGGGTDTLLINDDRAVGVSIDLTPGGAYSVGTSIDGFFAPPLAETVHTTRATVIENVVAAEGDDFVNGNDAANSIQGMAGDDALWGGNGDDSLDGGNGDDTLDGGAGIDTASFAAATSAVTANLTQGLAAGDTTGDDQLLNIENLTGSDHSDDLTGNIFANALIGNAGNDTLNGGRGSDTLEGGEGDDVLFGGTQADRLDGGEGNDSLLGGNGNDTVEGGSGSDTLAGSVGDDNLNGGGQGDRLFGDTGADTLNGGGGSDRVDYLTGSEDILVDLETGEATGGLAEGDTLISIESLFGGKGDDTLRALEDGSRINGAGGDDIVTGRSGDDILAGGNGNDLVTGDAGDDLMNGNRGDDTLDGGAGDDTLRGSAGSDTFIFSNGTGDDIVLDFRANDLLDLSDTTTDFTSLADVQSAATETEAGLLIDLGGGDSVLLANATLASLAADNLIL
ncbi:MAG: hypothetical protein JJ850_15975 [Kordiimonadaceae bacterium]|nr:hypothetical protein [Kordiimonadaceae bacterium]MBO6569586.1 hypothetical protein [Kordiimonadaceae bacterium]MBO6966121.1 hypothetical protein [Kordiimonadaceae bacterium]